MDRAYYDEYYFLERNHWWFIVRSKIIDDLFHRLFEPNKTYSILNIGVATGASNDVLEKFGEVTSIEYDIDCAFFTFRDSGKPILIASIEDLPFKMEEFDIVCAFDVIEHVENDKKSVFEMIRVCKPGGKIIITVPALMCLWSHHDEVNQHVRRYKMKEIIRLFKINDKKGFEIYSTYFNTFLFPIILLFRLISKLLPKKIIRHGAGSDFTIINNENIINSLLFRIFDTERILLKYLKYNFGASILYVWQKQKLSNDDIA